MLATIALIYQFPIVWVGVRVGTNATTDVSSRRFPPPARGNLLQRNGLLSVAYPRPRMPCGTRALVASLLLPGPLWMLPTPESEANENDRPYHCPAPKSHSVHTLSARVTGRPTTNAVQRPAHPIERHVSVSPCYG